MISIGVIARGKYGIRLIENIRKNSDFRASSIELPDDLPDFIESPAEYLNGLDFDRQIFSNDLIITYSLHPDLTPEIVRLAGEQGVRALIIAGAPARAGSASEIEKLSLKYNINIQIHEICCNIERCGNEIIDEFTACFGKPQISITREKGKITGIIVHRGAPCGSTWYMAKELEGTGINEAASRAGLLIQQYPCRAIRGTKGGIHKAAKLHKESIEKAIKECGL